MARTKESARRMHGSPPSEAVNHDQSPITSDEDPSDIDEPLPSSYTWPLGNQSGANPLSDVTIMLKTSEEQGITHNASASPSNLKVSNAAKSSNRPRKKVKGSLCSCDLSVQRDSSWSPPHNHVPSEIKPPVASKNLGKKASVQLRLQAWPGNHITVHTGALSAASSYFRKLFQDADGWCRECKTTTHVFEGHELEAAKHVLKFMYTRTLWGEGGLILDEALLPWVFKVAVRWSVSTCIEACIKALCGCKPTLDLLMVYPAWPDTRFNNLVYDATQQFLGEFLDAPSVMYKASCLKRLTALPQAAMLALLTSDFLKTDAEATVLLLLKAWYDANRGSCSSLQLQALKTGVRYSRLSPAYICGVLPHLPDFSLTPEQTRELWLSTTVGRGDARRLKELAGTCPKGWYLPTRYASEPCMTVSLTVNESDLTRHVAAVMKMRGRGKGKAPAEIRSKKVFGYGYEWTLSLTSATSEEALKLNVEVHAPIKKGAVVVLNCVVKFHFPGDDDELGPGEDSKISTNAPVSVSNVLGDLDEEGWLDYLSSDGLCFSADVSIPKR